MTCEPEIHKDNVGVDFILTIVECNPLYGEAGQDELIPVDLQALGITSSDVRFLKPDNTVMIRSGSFVTNGTDGKIHYVSVAGDLDQDGKWQIQGKVEDAGFTKRYYSEIEKFKVYPNIE